MALARLTKSRNKWIDGVLGGIGEHIRVSPDLLRIVVIVAVLFGQAHVLIPIYFILMIIMPEGSRYGRGVSHEKRDSTEYVEVEVDYKEPGDEMDYEEPAKDATDYTHSEKYYERKVKRNGNSGRTLQFLGLLLILSGISFLIENLMPWFWNDLRGLWRDLSNYIYDTRELLIGAALIAGGVWLLFKDKKKRA